jgi:hypothetical protein
MNKKNVCILVCTLLITTATLSGVGAMNIRNTSIINEEMKDHDLQDKVDQSQENCNDQDWLPGGVPNWQEFCPEGADLLKVDVHVGQYFAGSHPITLSIENSLGSKLTEKTLQATDLPSNTCDWVTFDVPDVNIKAGEQHRIVLTFDIGSEYAWSGSLGDPYPCGATSSGKGPDWDYCFRTYTTKGKSKNVGPEGIWNNPLFQLFMERHTQIFQILENILKL